jgi:hypothetical protein
VSNFYAEAHRDSHGHDRPTGGRPAPPAAGTPPPEPEPDSDDEE